MSEANEGAQEIYPDLCPKPEGDKTMGDWPKSDQVRAAVEDLLILRRRGYSIQQAAEQLRIPWQTAYRWLTQAGASR